MTGSRLSNLTVGDSGEVAAPGVRTSHHATFRQFVAPPREQIFEARRSFQHANSSPYLGIFDEVSKFVRSLPSNGQNNVWALGASTFFRSVGRHGVTYRS